MAKVIGLIDLHSTVSYTGLTSRRPVASVPFLGRYGMIDFVLSNMSNSGIERVGVLIQQKPRSLFKHLGNGNSWNFNSKTGGVSLLYNEKYANNPQYNHDINNMIENIAFLTAEDFDYVVIAPEYIVTTMDYSDLVEAHEKSGAEITVAYKKIKNADESFVGDQTVTVEKGLITKMEPNKGIRKNAAVCLETYCINKKTLLNIINKAAKVSSFFSLRDSMQYLCDEMKINAYEYRGYARCIDSLEKYFKHSLEFLDVDVSSAVFKSNWPIYTNTNDTPPTKYLSNSNVHKSFVANGAVIDGTVDNCIIGREVEIGKGAKLKNCIIFSGSKIAAGSNLENVIMDKRAVVEKKKNLKGNDTTPLYINEEDVV
ncbi:MAG: glucose-1-phosphate adenylyltransferase subunit GlgD [Thomasclavelia sp.]|jgi:glucose-1-phosphate adenylyltransferase|nr:glucose-1-phosphate adenylyltransferase subunit GlgD [Thomasclavelia sp.]